MLRPTQGNILQTNRRSIIFLATKVVTNKDLELAVEEAAKELSIRDQLPSIDNQLYHLCPAPNIIKPSVKSLFGMFDA